MSEPADLGDRVVEQAGRLGEQRLILTVFGFAGELDEHCQRDEVLLGAVMQVAFEASAFLVGSRDKPAS